MSYGFPHKGATPLRQPRTPFYTFSQIIALKINIYKTYLLLQYKMAELEAATKNDINNRIRSIQLRDQIVCALASLRNDACYPQYSEAKLLKNVTEWFGRLNYGTATTCVFPECGSGYLEWSAFIAF